MAMIRIAKISYDYHECKIGKNGTESIGSQIDKLIAETIAAGNLVSEITFGIDGIEEQHKLAEMVTTSKDWDYSIPVTDDDYKPKKR